MSDEPAPMRLALIAPPTATVPPSALGGLDVVRWLAEGLAGRGHEVTLIGAGLQGLTADRYAVVDTDPAAGPRAPAALADHRHAEAAGKVVDQLGVHAVGDHTRTGYLPAADRVLTARTVYGPAAGTAGLVPQPGHVGLVAVSDQQRRHAFDTLEALLHFIGVVAPGLPFAERPLSLEHDGPAVYVGPLLPGYGVEEAVGVAHQAGRPVVLANTRPGAGARAWAGARLRPLLGGGDRLLGEVSPPERWELLATACCLLAPTWREATFSLAAVEAMACGTPVVGLVETVLAEQVRDGTSGLLARSMADLPHAVERAAALEPAKVRAEAARRFDAAVMVVGYEALFQRLVGAAR